MVFVYSIDLWYSFVYFVLNGSNKEHMYHDLVMNPTLTQVFLAVFGPGGGGGGVKLPTKVSNNGIRTKLSMIVFHSFFHFRSRTPCTHHPSLNLDFFPFFDFFLLFYYLIFFWLFYSSVCPLKCCVLICNSVEIVSNAYVVISCIGYHYWLSFFALLVIRKSVSSHESVVNMNKSVSSYESGVMSKWGSLFFVWKTLMNKVSNLLWFFIDGCVLHLCNNWCMLHSILLVFIHPVLF